MTSFNFNIDHGKLAALTTSSFFASSALYINLVEHPARMSALNAVDALKQWQHSYPRALPIQATLALTSSLIGAGVAYYTKDNRIWLAFAGTMFANWPFTLLFIMPLNKQLMDTTELRARDQPANVLADLERWDNLHSVRTVLGLCAVGLAIYGLMP